MNLNYLSTCAQNKEVIIKESMAKIWEKCALCIQKKYMICKYDAYRRFEHATKCIETTQCELRHITTTCIEKAVHLNALAKKDLETFSPHIPLKRGFAFITRNGKCVKDINDLQENDELCVKFMDGNIDVIVKRCRKS